MNVTVNTLATKVCNLAFTDSSTPSSADLAAALQCLIEQVDSMSADPAKIFTSAITAFTLTPNKYVYTIGKDASRDFNMDRPQKIQIANLIDLSNPTYPIRNPIEIVDDAGWAAIRLQNAPTPIPRKLYYDSGDTRINSTAFGYGTIYLHGVPSAANQLELYTEQLLSVYSSLSDQIILPPGYYEALLYGTTKRFALLFGRPIDPTWVTLQQQAEMKLESRNLETPRMAADSGLPGGRPGYYDYRTNTLL